MHWRDRVIYIFMAVGLLGLLFLGGFIQIYSAATNALTPLINEEFVNVDIYQAGQLVDVGEVQYLVKNFVEYENYPSLQYKYVDTPQAAEFAEFIEFEIEITNNGEDDLYIPELFLTDGQEFFSLHEDYYLSLEADESALLGSTIEPGNTIVFTQIYEVPLRLHPAYILLPVPEQETCIHLVALNLHI